MTVKMGRVNLGRLVLECLQSGCYWNSGWRSWCWQLELQGMQSSSQIVTTNKPTHSFTGRMPFLLPNQQCHSSEGKNIWFQEQTSTHCHHKQLKRCVDKLNKLTCPSLAPITFFVISGLQSVIYRYWKNFCHVWWISYGLYVIDCICTLMHGVYI